MVTVEFYKMAVGGGVGRVLETIEREPFGSKVAFIEWAQEALPARRGDQRVWEWPEAVRACSSDGQKEYCWTLWDQVNAGKVLVHT